MQPAMFLQHYENIQILHKNEHNKKPCIMQNILKEYFPPKVKFAENVLAFRPSKM